MTQEELGENSGVSVRSISRLEQGSSVQMDNLIRILIALGLDSNIELLIPDQTSRPSYYLRENGNYRVRARKDDKKQEFKWGGMNSEYDGRDIFVGNEDWDSPSGFGKTIRFV